MTARVLYRVTMEDGSRLTVLAANGVEAADVAIGQYFAATGIKVCVEDYELAEGYDIA
jgi:hypothetical protein